MTDCLPLDIVHAVSYSLLLLNTDLHVADLVSRMSKNQFVRNTLTAIQTQLEPTPIESSSDVTSDASSIRGSEATHTENRYRSKRSDSITSWNSISKETILSSPAFSLAATSATSIMEVPPSDQMDLKSFLNGNGNGVGNGKVYDRAWEAEMEGVLKVSSG